MDKSDINKWKDYILEYSKQTSQIIIPEYLSLLKEGRLWIAKLITIASSILGGFILSTQNYDTATKLSLTILFSVVILGLILIYKRHRETRNDVEDVIVKIFSFHTNLILFLDLESSNNLSEDDKKLKDSCLKKLESLLENEGITENGTLSDFSRLLPERKSFDLGDIFLLSGFLISGLLLIFTQEVTTMLHLIFTKIFG